MSQAAPAHALRLDEYPNGGIRFLLDTRGIEQIQHGNDILQEFNGLFSVNGRFKPMFPHTLKLANVSLVRTEYYVAEKSDGERVFLFCSGKTGQVYLISRSTFVYRINLKDEDNLYSLLFTVAPQSQTRLSTLLDCELVLPKYAPSYSDVPKPVLFVFDALWILGVDYKSQPLPVRIQAIGKEVFQERWNIPELSGEKQRCPMDLCFKTIVPVSQLHSHILSNFETHDGKEYWTVRTNAQTNTRIFETRNDGLVFTPANCGYFAPPNLPILKWKYPHLNTIDLWILQDSPLHERRVLFGYMAKAIPLHPHAPPTDIVFAKSVLLSDAELQRIQQQLREPTKLIYECQYSTERGGWVPMKPRTDKKSPNFNDTVLTTMEAMIENITYDDLARVFPGSGSAAAAAAASTTTVDPDAMAITSVTEPSSPTFDPQVRYRPYKKPASIFSFVPSATTETLPR